MTLLVAMIVIGFMLWNWEKVMKDHVYKKVELVGSATDSIEAAIGNAIQSAGKSLRNLDWFEVTQVRGAIDGSRVSHYQVELKVGFRIED